MEKIGLKENFQCCRYSEKGQRHDRRQLCHERDFLNSSRRAAQMRNMQVEQNNISSTHTAGMPAIWMATVDHEKKQKNTQNPKTKTNAR